MKIKWTTNSNKMIHNSKELINLEYKLKKELLKLLLKYPSLDCCDDFKCYTFNYNLDTEKITISKTTPEPFYSKLKKAIKLHPNFSEIIDL